MGVLVGEMIRVVGVAPLGDPVEVTVKNYKLSLRKKEVEGVIVEEVS
jgi:ferrous iron transport protein A